MANCSLTFKYLTIEIFSKGVPVPYNIDENSKNAFEAMMNINLAPFCQRINQDGGHISVVVSGFGKDFSDWKLITNSPSIKDELMVYLNSK